MSPASKSKSKEKKASKEPQKTLSMPSGSANASTGIPTSAYNPLSGTFHALETVPASSALSLHANGRFRNIDDTDDHFDGAVGAGAEYDSVSNNGSCSGESDDHKEKNPAVRTEAIPGADNDKREKIRQKNERKHQRQRERRAQELHERCSCYLMSRKLEALAQQLVAMGFSHERATMALILNEGKVEESVSWLFEGGEDADKHRGQNLGEGNLKIDISEERARIADMELRCKCTKQEVERAVVASEGDLDKAAESLKELKPDPTSSLQKPEETGDPPTVSNFSVTGGQNIVRPQNQQKPNLPSLLLQRRDDKDFNYTKAFLVAGPPESRSKNMQSSKIIIPKMEWAKPQQPALSAEKRWPSTGSSPSVSYSLASPLQASPPPAKATEAHFMAVGSDYKHPGTVKEPVIMMQRPQSVNTKQVPVSRITSSPPGTATGWYPTNSVPASNGLMPHIPTTRSLSLSNLNSNQMFHLFHYQQPQHFVPGSSTVDSPVSNRGNGLWSRTCASPTLAAASSLGLFSGLGGSGCSSGASSPVDWSTAGSMAQLDYTSIDWSLDRGLSSPRPGGTWPGPGSFRSSTQMYDSSTTSGLGAKFVIRTAATGNREGILGLQNGGVANSGTSAPGSQEWTSPFEEKDIFSLPRHFVSSPSL